MLTILRSHQLFSRELLFHVLKRMTQLLKLSQVLARQATFAISILQQLEIEFKETQALVLAPTRELAQQIQKVILALGDYMGATCHACIGGTNVRNEMQKLQAEAPHIVVGTPGRVFDMLNRRYLSPKWIKMFVLDEADEMLSRGFKDQIYEIFQKLNTSIQVSFVSVS